MGFSSSFFRSWHFAHRQLSCKDVTQWHQLSNINSFAGPEVDGRASSQSLPVPKAIEHVQRRRAHPYCANACSHEKLDISRCAARHRSVNDASADTHLNMLKCPACARAPLMLLHTRVSNHSIAPQVSMFKCSVCHYSVTDVSASAHSNIPKCAFAVDEHLHTNVKSASSPELGRAGLFFR